jgi:hypothetical protein
MTTVDEMPSPVDFFGSARNAPQVDVADNETDEQLAERLQAQWRAERRNFERNEEVRRRANRPPRLYVRSHSGRIPFDEAKRWRRIGLWPIAPNMKELPIEVAERQHAEREAARRQAGAISSYRPDETIDDRMIPGDDVYRWMLNRALIERGPNHKGWARLRACPWQGDHERTASQHASWRTGRFGSFHCFGCRRTTRDFLLWVHGVDPVFPGIVRYALAFGWELRHA